jgi:Ca2+-binding RTX toxin-like protein
MAGSSSGGRGDGPRRLGIRATVAVIVTSLLASFGIVVPAPSVSALSGDDLAVAQGLESALRSLDGLDGLDELGDALPFTGITPTGPSGLDLPAVFDDLADDVAAVVGDATSTVEDLEDELNGTRSVGAVTVTIAVDISASGVTFTDFDITHENISVSLGYLSGDPEDPATFSLAGGDLDVDLALSFDGLQLDLEPAGLAVPSSAPAASLTVGISLPDPSIATQLGILDVDANGTVTADLTFDVNWIDPDASGSITKFELENTAPLDLFDVAIADPSPIAMNITLSSQLDGLVGVEGSVSLTHNLADGEPPAPTVNFGPSGELGDFTNMTASDVLAAIAQLTVSMRSMQLVTGNPDLPLLNENLAELGDWSDRITDLFVSKGLSTIENPVDLQFAPEEGVQCGNAVDDDGDGVIDEGCPGEPSDLEAKGLASIEDIIAELAAAIGFPGDDLDLAYAGNAVTFTIALDDESFFQGGGEQPGYNLAEELKKAGVTSLQLGENASINVTPSYDVNLTVGLDLSVSDPSVPITDRVFIVPDPAKPELSFDAPITGELDLTGQIGMLAVELGTGGPVTILGKRDSDDRPMVGVELTASGGDGRITVGEIFAGLSDVGVTASGDTLTVSTSEFDLVTTLNLGVPPVVLNASASLGSTSLGAATVTFSWPDLTVTENQPTVTASETFTDNFASFNIDPEDPLALFSTLLVAVDTALSAVEDIAGSEIDQEIPILNTSVRDLLDWVDGVQDAINALANDPAATLELLELTAEAAIADALDELDGVNDLEVPAFPDPTDFGSGEDFDPAAYADAVEGYVETLADFVALNGDYVTLGYVPGNSPGALTFDLDIGVCSSKDDFPGCTFEYPIDETFNLDLSEVAGADFGGIVDAEATGQVGLDYHVSASVHLGVELPQVVPDDGDADSLPQVVGAPKVFITDNSGISASVAGVLEDTEFKAALGPFELQVGETTAYPESGDECAPGDTTDDDGDGFVNDGCDALPNPETGTQCDIGNADDEDGDGFFNDGCPPIETPEEDAQCEAGNVDDDDGDGTADDINDGCPTQGDPEPETVCDEAPGAAVDDDGDGLVNDGCAAQGNVLVARAGAGLTLQNDPTPADDTDPIRYYLAPDGGEPSLQQFFDGLGADFGPAPGVNCPNDLTPGEDDFACAHLPVYAGEDPDLTFLGNVDISISDLDPFTAQIEGDDEIVANAQAAIEAFVFDLIAEGIAAFGDAVEDGLNAAAYDVEVPVIGEALDVGADIGGEFNQRIVQNVANLVGALNGASDFATIENEIRDYFWGALGGDAPAADRFILNYVDPSLDPVKEDHIIVRLVCTSDEVDCDDDVHGLSALRGVEIELAVGQEAATETTPFDWGVPGLRLSGENTLNAAVSWQVSLGFGVSVSDGFYLMGDTQVNDNVDDRDISVSASVDFGEVDQTLDDDPALEGDLAFLSAALWNLKDDRLAPGDPGDTDGYEAHEVETTFGVDFTSETGRVGLAQMLTLFNPTKWDVTLDGYVDFHTTLATTAAVGGGASGGAIPRLLADLHLEWAFVGSIEDGFQAGNVSAGFDEIKLDLGSFVAEFLAPVLKEVQRFTKPLQPIIDTLQAPIPGVSQLAELVGADPVTLLDLMEAVSGADLTLIRRLLDVISFGNSIPTGLEPDDPELIILIGDFLLDSDQLLKPELPANSKGNLIDELSKDTSEIDGAGGVFGQLAAKSGDADFNQQVDKAKSSDGGFSFPAFEEPARLFNLLVGEDVELVEFDAGTLRAEVGWSQSFGPITLGPVPVSVVVSIGAAVEGRFVIGYDTKGIRLLVKNLTDGDDSNNGLVESVGTLFAGVYLGDHAADGSDPPEIRLTLEGAVGAAVDLVVIKVGIEAGIRATLDLNLHDGGYFDPIPPENLDGKLRIDEIITFFSNPLCLFDVSGKLEAFIRLFVTLDLFLFSVTYKQTIVNITLLELNNITAELCKPPEPKPATPQDEETGGILRLNVGSRSGFRNFDEGNSDEKVTIRQLTDGVPATISVTYKGFTGEYPNTTKVVGGGAGGDDTFVIEGGDISGVCGGDGIVSPTVPGYWSPDEPSTGVSCLADGPDDDSEPDHEPGETVTFLVDFVVPLDLCGGTGNDVIGGGQGDDLLSGDGTFGENATGCDHGGDGTGEDDDNDVITGEGGDDDLWGNDGEDVIDAGPGADDVWGGEGIDELVGGPGPDTLHGGPQGDNLSGGPEADPCPGDEDAVDPDDPVDVDDSCGNTAADDKLYGDGGDDTMEGDHGRDKMYGGADNDTMVGGPGIDTMNGDAGFDSLFGNEGDDVMNGGTDDDDLFGGLGDDEMDGGAHDDDIVGEEGVDTIQGGDGRDVILGDLGVVHRDPAPGLSDFTPSAGEQLLVELTKSSVPPAAGDDIDGGGDDDRIWGQEGDDQIDGDQGDGTDGNDVIRGNGGNDGIRGNGGGDDIFGDDGIDTIYGDAAPGNTNPGADGSDTIRGGNDDDIISGNAKGDRLFGDSGHDTIYGDATVEEADCNDDEDYIVGGSGNDLVFGNADADQIFGEGGTDRLIGGSDSPDVCDGSDTILGGVDDDTIAGDNATIGGGTPPAYAVTLFLDGQGTGDVLYGEADSDRVFGQQGSDDISGGGQQDFLEGNAGIDYIDGDDGDDRIVGGTSTWATVRANSDTTTVAYDVNPDTGDFLNGNDGADVIAGDNAGIAADGATVMTAASGAGISGDDVIHGDAGEDRIYGQLGGDDLYGDADGDYLVGDLGVISALPDAALPEWPGGAPNYDVDLDAPGPEVVAADDASGGLDDIRGGTGDDHLFGGVGPDVMRGNLDDDYMEGNSGIDEMYGNVPDSEATADEDDMIGGSSSWTRSTSLVRFDDGESIMQGNGDHDVMLGDNGDIERVVDPEDSSQWAEDEVIEGARKRIVTLLDREKTGATFDSVNGPDRMQGNDGSDRMYGEGDSDLVQGNADDDLIEGNQAGDWLEGNGGEDDIIGGSSLYASDGGIALAGAGADLGDPDGSDAIFGGGDADVLTGDNAIIIRDTEANSDVYDAALADAYFTTDHLDGVPGWWLGVDSDRLVILLDRETLDVDPVNGDRFGVDLISGGAGADVAFGQDADDWISGGTEGDTVEGNGGGDEIYGDLAPEDVPIPGGLEGVTTWSETGFVSAGEDRDGPAGSDGEDDLVGGSNVAHRDGDDDVQGDGEDDFILGDNGTLERWIKSDLYQQHRGDGDRDRIFRTAIQLAPGTAPESEFGDDALDGNDGDDAIWGQDGDDLLRGQADDDDLTGELGDDTIYGGTGDDAMIGDRGSILNTELGAEGALFTPDLDVVEDYNGPPFLTGVGYFTTGRFDRRVDLLVDVAGSVGGPNPDEADGELPYPGIMAGGNDRMRGGPGHDSMHGAWGDDLMNGDEGGDWLFGSHGSDVMWGGYGDAAGTPELGSNYELVDRLFGGKGGDPANDTGVITGGADILDFRPRTEAETPEGEPADPAAWFEMTDPYDDGTGNGGSAVSQDHQGTDWIYGGYDRDVMQGDVTDPGPNGGDRMWDWTGAFNLYTHCDPDYGGFNDQRARSPEMEQFLEKLAFDSGAGSSIADVQESSSSAYRELALVYKFDTKDNSGKAYPTTPGHFDEIAECDIPPDIP